MAVLAVESIEKTMHLPSKRELHKVIQDVFPKRDYTNETNDWYVQYFTKSERYRGWLEYDPCMSWVPKKVREDMNKTKMMQLRIPVDLHKWFKRYTQEEETTMTRVVIAYLELLRSRTRKNFEIDQI